MTTKPLHPDAPSSYYGNPAPAHDRSIEHRTLTIRLSVARATARRHRGEGNHAAADAWARTVDELLDHLANLDDRVTCAQLDRLLGAR